MLPNGWLATTIGDQVTLQRGVDITRAEQRAGLVPVVSSGGISSWHDTPAATGPGVVLGRKGVVGSVYYIAQDYWPHDTTLWVKDFKGNLPRFVFYFFRSIASRLASLDVGSANPTLNRNHVHPIEVTWPNCRSEQERIAAVLGSLDDKIEQNRRTGRKLEELARAVFKAWFVDFEPVKAKAAGATAFPGMPPETFAALPKTLKDSPLGPVPEGWEVKPIGDVVTVRGGGTPSTKDDSFWTGGTHYWATPKDLSSLQHPILLSTERRITNAGVAKISSGVLPIDTVLLSSRAPVGYLALAKVPTAINQGFIAIECEGPLKPHFILHWLDARMDEIKGRASGTTFAEISKSAFRPIPSVVPPPTMVSVFEDTAKPMFDMITHLVAESAKLAILRDYLLPRLLSGRVRVGGVNTLQPGGMA